MVTIPGFLNLKDLFRRSIFFKTFNKGNVIKMKNKPYPTLLQTLFLSKKFKKGHQNLVRLFL
jgi:hypothetical protein